MMKGITMVEELEKDYAATLELIKQKVKESAEALAAAAKLASSIDESLMSMHDENYRYLTQPLLDEMDEVGWSTSSLSC